jgi:NADH-quinone oxidoreductase subunit M
LLLYRSTTTLVPLILLAAFKHNYDNPSTFYALVLFSKRGLIGVCLARMLFVLLLLEVALIPIYFLVPG